MDTSDLSEQVFSLIEELQEMSRSDQFDRKLIDAKINAFHNCKNKIFSLDHSDMVVQGKLLQLLLENLELYRILINEIIEKKFGVPTFMQFMIQRPEAPKEENKEDSYMTSEIIGPSSYELLEFLHLFCNGMTQENKFYCLNCFCLNNFFYLGILRQFILHRRNLDPTITLVFDFHLMLFYFRILTLNETKQLEEKEKFLECLAQIIKDISFSLYENLDTDSKLSSYHCLMLYILYLLLIWLFQFNFEFIPKVKAIIKKHEDYKINRLFMIALYIPNEDTNGRDSFWIYFNKAIKYCLKDMNIIVSRTILAQLGLSHPKWTIQEGFLHSKIRVYPLKSEIDQNKEDKARNASFLLFTKGEKTEINLTNSNHKKQITICIEEVPLVKIIMKSLYSHQARNLINEDILIKRPLEADLVLYNYSMILKNLVFVYQDWYRQYYGIKKHPSYLSHKDLEDSGESTKTLIDFIKCVKKCFRKALKHGNDINNLFSMIESYIDLRFIAYKKLFGENANEISENTRKNIFTANEDLFTCLHGLDLSYDELTKLLIDDNEDEDIDGNINSEELENKNDIGVDQLENSSWTSKIAIIYYILHHNEIQMKWIKTEKSNAFFGGVEVNEIEIQRFKELNIREILDFTEKHYSKVPLESSKEIKESIYSKILKLCTFQVPQYFSTQVLLITEFLKKNEDKKLVRLSRRTDLQSALESLILDENSSQIYVYNLHLSERPSSTAIKVIRFFGRRYRRFKIRYDYEAFFNFYQDYGVFHILFSESFQNQLFGNLKKEKKLTSLSCFNFNLSECVLKNERLIRIWCDCITVLLGVEYHQTLKKISQFEGHKDDIRMSQSITVLQNEWTLYKCLIIQCMLDVIILAKTEIKEENQVEMITRILCEKINDTLVDDNTDIIKLLIHQAFPIELADILIERVEIFHVSINFIEEFLLNSLNDLEPIFQEQIEEKKAEEPILFKENTFDFQPEHYRSIYRTVFLLRILAKLSEKFSLEMLQDIAINFFTQAKKYLPILSETEKDDPKLAFLVKEFNKSCKILVDSFEDLKNVVPLNSE
ncbi:unnamed protein product [Moneuplotes crassus]|uniref:Uncharacterized protein n=2 Tax=Euplotes crassus TaxID=5936 RepID=A0AAD1XSA1_EUPCR|nr:unnamed protein product [Moneuplotes crassus]